MSTGEQALHGWAGVPLALRGPAPLKVVAGYGFWLFLLSDIIVFAALFAAYAVLAGSTVTNSGPTSTTVCRSISVTPSCSSDVAARSGNGSGNAARVGRQ